MRAWPGGAALGLAGDLLRPQPPRDVQHVEVRQLVPRRAQAVERPPRLHHRHVEGPAVVGDQDRRLGPRPFADRADQRPLGGEAREHELADQEAAVLAGQRAADQEGDRAGAAGQPRRLQIQVQDARPRRVGRRRVAGDERDVVRRHARVPQLQRAVPVGRRVVALDDQRLAERPVDLRRPGQRRRHRRVDQRQAVVADRLVGQLADARRAGADALAEAPARCPSPARAGDPACSSMPPDIRTAPRRRRWPAPPPTRPRRGRSAARAGRARRACPAARSRRSARRTTDSRARTRSWR